MAKDFNADFYITCATVIPVLFLAVAVQGQAYETVLLKTLITARTRRDDGKTHQAEATIASFLLRQVAYFIWVAGAFGELYAVLALYEGHDVGDSRVFVLGSTLILVFALAQGPYLPWSKGTASASGITITMTAWRKPAASTAEAGLASWLPPGWSWPKSAAAMPRAVQYRSL